MRRVLLVFALSTSVAAAAACGVSASTPLAVAASANDASGAQRLLADGHRPDELDPAGLTPLMAGAREGAIDAMRVLLAAGADPNAVDGRSTGWTPLLHAVHKRQTAAVRLLLEHGADPNRTGPGGGTPLIMAADDPNPAIVTLLLSFGADPRVEGEDGSTALTRAVSGGALSDITDRPLLGGCRSATVRVLLASAPDLRMPATLAGHSAVWWARMHRCGDVLQLLGARSRQRPASRR